MKELLKANATIGTTTNGATTYTTSLNNNVDFFGTASALSVEDSVFLFKQAFAEDKLTALKNLFYLRDIRQGAGRRESFRQILNWLLDSHSEDVALIVPFISEYGRFDDLVMLFEFASVKGKSNVRDACFSVISNQLTEDLNQLEQGESVSLLAKWMPSINKSKKGIALKLAKALKMSPKEYRKTLAKLRAEISLVETHLSEKDYASIDFEKTPSQALFRYRQAFHNHMEEEYDKFMDKALDSTSTVKVNASTLYPHTVVEQYTEERGWRVSMKPYDKVLEATWKGLSQTLGEQTDGKTLVVADTSASMSGIPHNVATALAIYSSEQLEGVFQDCCVTFSHDPQFIDFSGLDTLHDKMEAYNKYSIVANTDIEKTMMLLLNTAKQSPLGQESMPTRVLIISDMEFDAGTEGTVRASLFENLKATFENEGFTFPKIVFWNVNAHMGNVPVRSDARGFTLVSGFSTNLFQQIATSSQDSPVDFMNEVLNSGRYDFLEPLFGNVA